MALEENVVSKVALAENVIAFITLLAHSSNLWLFIQAMAVLQEMNAMPDALITIAVASWDFLNAVSCESRLL